MLFAKSLLEGLLDGSLSPEDKAKVVWWGIGMLCWMPIAF